MSASRKLKRRQDAQNGKLKPVLKLKDMFKGVDPFMDADFQAKLSKAEAELEPRIIGMIGQREGMSHEAWLKVLRDLMITPKMNDVLAMAQDESQEKLMRDRISEMEADIKKVLASLPKDQP